MKRIAVGNSSQILSIGYDKATETLEVEFVKGSVYQYDAVPSHVYEALLKAESIGRTFGITVKGIYTCRKM